MKYEFYRNSFSNFRCVQLEGVEFCAHEFLPLFGFTLSFNSVIELNVRTKNPKKAGFRKVVLEKRNFDSPRNGWLLCNIHIGNYSSFIYTYVFEKLKQAFGTNILWVRLVSQA